MTEKNYHFDAELYACYLIYIIDDEENIVLHQLIFGQVKYDNKNRFEKDTRIFTSKIEKIMTTDNNLIFVKTLNSIYKVDSIDEIIIRVDYFDVFRYLVIFENISPLELQTSIENFEYQTSDLNITIH